MFFGVTELVYGPKGVIPSFIWIETSKKGRDLRREMTARLPFAIDVLIKLIKAICEREIGFLQTRASASESGSISALIQSGPQIVDGIEDDTRKDFWNGLSKPDLVGFLTKIQIKIGNMPPWLFADKSLNEIFEITDVMMRAIEGQPWAMEQVIHEREARSDEKPRVSENCAALFEHAAATPQTS